MRVIVGCVLALIVTSFTALPSDAAERTAANSGTSAKSSGGGNLDQSGTDLPPGVDSLLAGIDALTATAGENLPLERSIVRLSAMRQLVTEATQKRESADIDFEIFTLLCSPRAEHLTATAAANYLGAVSKEIKKLGTPDKIDDLTSAVLSFFKTYHLQINGDPNVLKKEQDKILIACQADLSNYSSIYYGQQVGSAEAGFLVFLTPFAALVKGIIDLINPTVEAVAKAQDQAKRRKAVLTFLKQKDNISKIKTGAEELGKELATEMDKRRLELVGEFVEQITVARSLKFDPSKYDKCTDAMFSAEGSTYIQMTKVTGVGAGWDKPSDEFILCEHQVWDAYSKPLTAALKSAEQYDALADAPFDRGAAGPVAKLDKSLNAVVSDKPTAADLKNLWDAVVQLLGIAEGAIAALSPENQTKIKGQIDDLAKAWD